MHTDDDRRPPVTRISEGMRVFDRAGQDVGFVKMVHLGDPQAATSEGGSDGRGLLDVVAGLGEKAEPDLLNPFTERMLRHGYVKIECSGFFAGDAHPRRGLALHVGDSDARSTTTADAGARCEAYNRAHPGRRTWRRPGGSVTVA